MEFDINKVYTAVNADQLKIGSLIVAGCNLKELELKVKKDRHTHPLIEVTGKDRANRFGVDDCGCLYSLNYYPLAYLIEPPKELKYKPFSNTGKAMEAISIHGGWVKNKDGEYLVFITGIDIKARGRQEIYMAGEWRTASDLFELFVFADDGSPCGEWVDE